MHRATRGGGSLPGELRTAGRNGAFAVSHGEKAGFSVRPETRRVATRGSDPANVSFMFSLHQRFLPHRLLAPRRGGAPRSRAVIPADSVRGALDSRR